MHLKLREEQPKIITYLFRLLYQDLMRTTDQKITMDTNIKRRKLIKHSNNENQQTQQKRTKEERKKKN